MHISALLLHFKSKYRPLLTIKLTAGFLQSLQRNAKVMSWSHACCCLLIHWMCKVPAKLFGIDHLTFLKCDRHIHTYIHTYICQELIPHSEPCHNAPGNYSIIMDRKQTKQLKILVVVETCELSSHIC